MAQFAKQLQRIDPGEIGNEVEDATKIEGAWDFTLSFSRSQDMLRGAEEGGHHRERLRRRRRSTLAGLHPHRPGAAGALAEDAL